jgi:Peptidase family M1 domain
LTHAYVESPEAWLSEGVADFMATLWTERQNGRNKALESLGSSRQALALVEPTSPGLSAGQPLAEAYTPIYYRTKAVYVLWMLRDLIGDKALAGALQGYDAAQDAANTAGKPAPSLEKYLEQTGQGRDMEWFFSQWVKADDGLPDLSIDHVYPSVAEGGNWLVAVDMSNTGYAAAEVPLTVRSRMTSVTRRVLIPAQGKTVQRILIQGEPTQVELNDGSVPEVEASEHVTNLHATSAANQPIQLQ